MLSLRLSAVGPERVIASVSPLPKVTPPLTLILAVEVKLPELEKVTIELSPLSFNTKVLPVPSVCFGRSVRAVAVAAVGVTTFLAEVGGFKLTDKSLSLSNPTSVAPETSKVPLTSKVAPAGSVATSPAPSPN